MDFSVAQAPAGVRKAVVVFTDGRDEPAGATGPTRVATSSGDRQE